MHVEAGRDGPVGGLAPTDDELLLACRLEQPDAFALLASRHAPYMQQLAERLLSGDHHAAQDVVQECLVKLHAASKRDDRPLKVRAWLSVVVRNACMDEHRRRVPQPMAEAPDTAVVDSDPFGSDPFLDQAWEALGERFRTALHHRELLGLSYEEIAAAMGISHSAVQTLLFRARGALRREYQRAGGELLGCGAFGLALLAFRDGEAVRDGEQLTAHLDSCGACDAAWNRVDELASLLRGGHAPSRAQAPAAHVKAFWNRCWTALCQFLNGHLAGLSQLAHASVLAGAVPLSCVAALVTPPGVPAAGASPQSHASIFVQAEGKGGAVPIEMRLSAAPPTILAHRASQAATGAVVRAASSAPPAATPSRGSSWFWGREPDGRGQHRDSDQHRQYPWGPPSGEPVHAPEPSPWPSQVALPLQSLPGR